MFSNKPNVSSQNPNCNQDTREFSKDLLKVVLVEEALQIPTRNTERIGIYWHVWLFSTLEWATIPDSSFNL